MGDKELSADVLEAGAASLWEFDRICFYLVKSTMNPWMPNGWCVTSNMSSRTFVRLTAAAV